MERITTQVYQGVRGYWRRRRYERLSGKSRDVSRLKWRRRFWGVRITPKLKFKLRLSPKKLIIGLRNVYVNMMMRLANSSLVAGTGSYGEARFGMKPAVKGYDEKVIMEFYKALVMRQALMAPVDGPQIGVTR
ncbi:uncharacterized protein LOC143634792 [Bidens hawaiensis]|uniref:uncharacterized protein LOC143634792 n=1 Tax=Bidens hawaiensis TaxID=980011 RepID=UPI00404B1118